MMIKDLDYLMTLDEVAGACRCTEATVRRWIRSKKLAAVVLPGGNYRVRYGTVAALIQSDTADAEDTKN
jgi:excisionase family DNA binding protein